MNNLFDFQYPYHTNLAVGSVNIIRYHRENTKEQVTNIIMNQSERSEILAGMRQLEPHEFEEFVAVLWELQEWETQVTGQSHDRGTDIIAETKLPTEIQIHIQAKRYGKNSKVSGPDMQKYGSLTKKPDVDVAMVVTSGSFTSQAVSLADEFNIKLVNGETLVELISELDAKRLLSKFVADSESEQRSLPEKRVENKINIPDSDVEKVKPTKTTSSGSFLKVDIIGAEFVRGVLESKHRENIKDPIDGMLIALEITNTHSGGSWEFLSNNANQGAGGVAVYDSEGYKYEAQHASSYTGLATPEPTGWKWGRAEISAKSRSRLAVYVDLPRDTTITAVEYSELVWQANKQLAENYEEEENLRLSVSPSIESETPDLPKEIKDMVVKQ